MIFKNAKASRHSTTKRLSALCFTLALAACGGGGGDSPELVAGHALPNALYSTVPATASLMAGTAQTYTVGGGTPFYKASSSDVSVATATVSGSTLSITSVSPGTAQISVFDATGKAVSATVTVVAATASASATNVLFVGSTPQFLYLTGSVGATQAQVAFKVVDAVGNPLQNKNVRVALNSAANGATLGTLGNKNPVDLTSDASGLVSALVFSGTVPAALNLTATLLDANKFPTPIFSSSNQLTVASGSPTQKSLSLAVGQVSLEADERDGETTTVTLSMADRQGNPVPAGTQVNFVSQTGVMLPATCFVPASTPPVSSCSVTFRSSGTRTGNGLVSIMAFVEGEEDFDDNNGNNVYDMGEKFYDLGRAFRDDTGQPLLTTYPYTSKYSFGETQIPRDGVERCQVGQICVPDGIWGTAHVRTQTTLVWATGKANITGTAAANGFTATVSDLKDNSVPTGSIIAVSVTDATPDASTSGAEAISCTLTSPSSITVPNTIAKLPIDVKLTGCTKDDSVLVTVTTPLGTVTTQEFPIQ